MLVFSGNKKDVWVRLDKSFVPTLPNLDLASQGQSLIACQRAQRVEILTAVAVDAHQ